MSFKTSFDTYVCVGDTIRTQEDGFEIVARIEQDESEQAPDEINEGFWPSLYIDHPGFIGPGNGFRQRFDKAQAEAQAIMDAWEADEWFYCGVVLSIALQGITLETHAASLWGVEANYPGSDNSYLLSVANELLPEALSCGHAALKLLYERTTTNIRV